jgi:hypothetical protein
MEEDINIFQISYQQEAKQFSGSNFWWANFGGQSGGGMPHSAHLDFSLAENLKSLGFQDGPQSGIIFRIGAPPTHTAGMSQIWNISATTEQIFLKLKLRGQN